MSDKKRKPLYGGKSDDGIVRGTTQIQDATLSIKDPTTDTTANDIEVTYDEVVKEKRFELEDENMVEDAPPLEITEELEAKLIEEEEKKEGSREKLRAQTKIYDNGKNVWRLITKTSNEFLDWEHVTTAMEVGAGCIVMVKEAIGQKMHSTATYVPGAILEVNENGKWELK